MQTRSSEKQTKRALLLFQCLWNSTGIPEKISISHVQHGIITSLHSRRYLPSPEVSLISPGRATTGKTTVPEWSARWFKGAGAWWVSSFWEQMQLGIWMRRAEEYCGGVRSFLRGTLLVILEQRGACQEHPVRTRRDKDRFLHRDFTSQVYDQTTHRCNTQTQRKRGKEITVKWACIFHNRQ